MATDPPPPPPPSVSLDYSFTFLKTPSGLLRGCEAALALAAIICGAVGASCDDDGRFGFFFFVVITTFLQAVIVIIIFIYRIQNVITSVNIPLTLLFNDSIVLVFYFMASLLMMLSIGWCYRMVTARVFASLFSVANFLTLVGLVYLDYLWWKGSQPEIEQNGDHGTTVTESSPTVLTLS